MNGQDDRPNVSSALVARAAAIPSAVDDVRMQHLWLSLQQRSWRSLAVLPATKGIDTLPAANKLAKIAWWYTGQPACVLDMRDLSLRLLEHQIRDMAAQLQGGERVLVALRGVSENPTAIPLAMAADAAVLCVELGKTDVKGAKRTLAAIGRERFLGAVLVSPGREDALEPVPHGPADPPGDEV
ncbi:MAG TPA: hypothetical protein VF765_07365 [Polyangiaceae bacterium]